jgi:pyroglutamyl-peptidase
VSSKPAKAGQVVFEKTKAVLVTAFEPFGDSDVNASQTILQRLAGTSPSLRTGTLPVRRNTVYQTLAGLITEHEPAAIIMLGEAGPEEVIRLELVALNHDDFRMPDNDGIETEPSRIVDAGPDAYFSTVNVHSIQNAVPTDDSYASVIISLTAGSFLCNHSYFVARHFHASLPTVFVHIPCLREETHTRDAFDRVTRSVNCIVQEITATLAVSTPD